MIADVLQCLMLGYLIADGLATRKRIATVDAALGIHFRDLIDRLRGVNARLDLQAAKLGVAVERLPKTRSRKAAGEAGS